MYDTAYFPRPTVLVLGAGASYPYGFPLGGQLLAWIGGGGRGAPFTDDEFARALWDLGHDEKDIKAFRYQLGIEQPASIDAFLAAKPHFSQIGKHAIAYVLTRCERPGYVFYPPRPEESPCYNLLCEAYKQVDARSERLKVITFNYDRSLEFMYRSHRTAKLHSDLAFVDSHYTDPDEVDWDTGIPEILHVYGSLGDLKEHPYEPDRPLGDIPRRAESIRVIGERALDEVVETARTWLREAWVVAFVGLGGDEQNMQMLGLNEGGEIRRRFGGKPRDSSIGWPTEQIKVLHALIPFVVKRGDGVRRVDGIHDPLWFATPEALSIGTHGFLERCLGFEVKPFLTKKYLECNKYLESTQVVAAASAASRGGGQASCIGVVQNLFRYSLGDTELIPRAHSRDLEICPFTRWPVGDPDSVGSMLNRLKTSIRRL
ncbi:MAG: hypothetical protein AAF333_13785 [Planctomycetota bacterium]